MLRKGGQKESFGTSLGKDLTNDNIDEINRNIGEAGRRIMGKRTY